MQSQSGEPKIQNKDAQPYVAIPIKVTVEQWESVIALVDEVRHWLEEHDIQMAGAPFFRYWVVGDWNKEFVMEVGVPVAEPVVGDDQVKAGSIPAGSYATLVHHGNPYGIEASHKKLREWAEAQGRELKFKDHDGQSAFAGVFDFYHTNPADEPNPNNWSTEVAHLLAEPALKS